jgi:hypothetical protein
MDFLNVYLSMNFLKYSIVSDFNLVIRQPDGPLVDLVAVRVRVGEFFASPDRRCEVVQSR